MVDTNVVVSAALQPVGWEARLIKLIAYHGVQLWASVEVLAEYREVLNRPKFAKLDHDHVKRLLTLIGEEAVMVVPTYTLKISKHEPDNRFYECAAAAHADYLVTGNTRHFTKNYKNTQVVTARQLLERLAKGRTTI